MWWIFWWQSFLTFILEKVAWRQWVFDMAKQALANFRPLPVEAHRMNEALNGLNLYVSGKG